MRERVAQTNEEIRGLTAQQEAKEAELELIEKELIGVTELYQKNLVSISRITQLQRDQTRLQGERGQFIADIARARGKISETELQIIQVDQDFRTDVLKDLREAQGKIAELKERVTAAEDQLKRVDIRAPQAGIRPPAVGAHRRRRDQQRRNHHADRAACRRARGGGQGRSAGHRSDRHRGDGDRAYHGRQPAHHSRRSTACLRACRPTSRTSRSSKTPRSRRRPTTPFASRCRQRRWRVSRTFASFPACRLEAFIQTHERTPLQYLLKPLREQVARTFRER